MLALPEVRAHLDLGRPVAVGLLAVLPFVSDADDPAGAGATWKNVCPALQPVNGLRAFRCETDYAGSTSPPP